MFYLTLSSRGCLTRTLRLLYYYFKGKKGCLFLNYIIVFPWSGQNKISVENKPTLLSEVSQSVTGTLYAN